MRLRLHLQMPPCLQAASGGDLTAGRAGCPANRQPSAMPREDGRIYWSPGNVMNTQ